MVSKELRRASQSRPIIINGSSSVTDVSSLLMPVAAAGALGYGYMWWKAIRSRAVAASRECATMFCQNIYHKHQPGSWECGYYCMLYMEKLCLLYAAVDMHEVFPHDMNPFPMDVIEGLVDTNCLFIMDSFTPVCEAQIMVRRSRRVLGL